MQKERRRWNMECIFFKFSWLNGFQNPFKFDSFAYDYITRVLRDKQSISPSHPDTDPSYILCYCMCPLDGLYLYFIHARIRRFYTVFGILSLTLLQVWESLLHHLSLSLSLSLSSHPLDLQSCIKKTCLCRHFLEWILHCFFRLLDVLKRCLMWEKMLILLVTDGLLFETLLVNR